MADVKAMAAVKTAVRNGVLPHISTHTCCDCGNQAEHYDHRDYNNPLDVSPVCRRCNALRGKAKELVTVQESRLKSILSEKIDARISEENDNKLRRYCKDKGITLSQWVTQRIELMRVK